ncbi:MAG: hypothetical protein ACI936_000848 [Paraglaciecola sp.]|jgi:hypothetical protein
MALSTNNKHNKTIQMGSNMTDQNKHSIATFAALKTSIANGEEQSVKELLANQPMQELEKSYLIDLAKLNNNVAIIKLLENIPLNE